MRVAERIRQMQPPDNSVAIWWLGQNSFILKGAGTTVMIDPFFRWYGPPEKYVHKEPCLEAEELGPDAVLCTHAHRDHTDREFLSELAEHWPEVRFYGPPESGQWIGEAGVPRGRFEVVDSGGEFQIRDVRVEVLWSKTPEVSDVTHVGYIIRFPGGPAIYNSGDIMRGVTREPTLMEPLQRAAPDVALITMSPTDDEFPDFDEAADLARKIGAKVAVPAHYECFAKRTYDPSEFVDQFVASDQTRAVVVPYCGVYTYPEAVAASDCKSS